MLKLLKFLVFVVVILVVAVLGLGLFADSAAKAGVEKGGTYALGTPTTVASVSVGVLSGKLGMDDLRIANPPGFSADPFFAMKRLETEVPLSQLTSDRVEIPRVALTGIRLNLEQGAQGNWSVIMDNLKRFESGSKKEEEAGGKRFVIRELVITDTAVGLNLAPVAGTALKREIPLPEIRLKDVGAENNQGVLLAEAANIVVKSLLDAVSKVGGGAIPADLAKDLQGRLGSLTQIGQSGAKVMDALQGAAKDAEKLGGDLKNILGGKK